MKRFTNLIICALICATSVFAQSDSLSKAYQERFSKLEQSLKNVKTENEVLKQRIRIQEEKVTVQDSALDSLKSVIALNTENIKITASQLGIKINETNCSLKTKADYKEVQTKTLWGICLFALLVIVSAFIYYLLHQRIVKSHADVSVLKQKADKLNEDILNQFSLEMVEMQKIATSLAALSSTQASQVNNATPDHSLIKTLADRITFMEMTLYKMDKTVKGHKTLIKAIANMKNNLFANGYELIDMLGKSYHEGMLVNNVDFVDDETLKKGEQIITKIIKPQINYKGQMIQSAQIQVSKNF